MSSIAAVVAGLGYIIDHVDTSLVLKCVTMKTTIKINTSKLTVHICVCKAKCVLA
jgi:hypothetical protein